MKLHSGITATLRVVFLIHSSASHETNQSDILEKLFNDLMISSNKKSMDGSLRGNVQQAPTSSMLAKEDLEDRLSDPCSEYSWWWCSERCKWESNKCVDNYASCKVTPESHCEDPDCSWDFNECVDKYDKRHYDGIAVTTIDYEIPDPSRPNRVRFSGKISGEINKKAAVFLTNIDHVEGNNVDHERIYEADKVTPSEAYEAFVEVFGDTVEPLFYVHGYNNEPGYVFKEASKANSNPNLKKYKVVPVIWPSCGGGYGCYRDDRFENAVGASKGLKEGILGMNAFPKKTLMTHSMGNWVLRGAADERVKFDNIFMVAADVPFNLFESTFIKDESDDGIEIFNMLKRKTGTNTPEGKIYVLSNWGDEALEVSANMLITNSGVNRLGQSGVHMYDCWGYGWCEDKGLTDERVRNYIENFVVEPTLVNLGHATEHSYHLYDFALEYYDSKYIE